MGPAPVINMIIGYLVMVRITHSFAIALEDIFSFQGEIYGHNLLTHYVEMHPDTSSSKRMTFGL
jgi:hypothetical protein